MANGRTPVRSIAYALCLSIAILAAGCGPDATSATRAFLQSGDKYTSQQKYREALIEYRNAVQLAPENGEARLKLADTYARLRNPGYALQEYRRAVDLLPNDLSARLKAADILLMAGRFSEAEAHARRALEIEPKNVDGLVLHASALAGLQKIDQALASIDQALAVDPGRSVTYERLGGIRTAAQDVAKAEAAFLKAVELAPQSAGARLALANFYWAQNRLEDALTHMKAAADIDGGDPTVMRALASLYINSGRGPEGEQYLQRLADLDPGNTGELTQAAYYLATRQFDKARTIFEKVPHSDQGSYRRAQIGLADIRLAGGDREGARQIVDTVLAAEPRYADGLIRKAEMLSEVGKLEEAQAAARTAVEVAADSVMAHLTLARVHAARGQFDEALREYAEAATAGPTLPTPEIEMARVHVRASHLDEAERSAANALRKSPGHLEALLLLARIKTMQGKPAEAEKAIAAIPTGADSDAAAETERGLVQLSRNNRLAARADFEKVLAAVPSQPEVLSAMVQLDLQAKRGDQARTRVENALRHNPANARLHLIAARMYATVGDAAAAEASLKKAIEMAPTHLEAYVLLGRFYASHNQVGRAIAEFERLLQQQPKSAIAHTMIGLLLEKQNKRAEAQAHYERALDIDPKAPVAGNNLAWLLVEIGGNLDIAESLARTARTAAPESADVADTLGWILYKKGAATRAIEPLQDAVRRQPDNGLFLYHLGLAAAHVGDVQTARRTLPQALKRDPGSAHAPDARAALARLPR